MLSWVRRWWTRLRRVFRQGESGDGESRPSVEDPSTSHREGGDGDRSSSTTGSATEGDTKESATPDSARCDAPGPVTDDDPSVPTSVEQRAEEEVKEVDRCPAPDEAPKKRCKAIDPPCDGETKKCRESPSSGASGDVPPKPPREIADRRGESRKHRARPKGESRRSQKQPAPQPRPELICRKQPGSPHWEVTLVATDEGEVEAVTRNGEELPCDVGGEWPLRALTGEVSARLKDGCSIAFSLAGEEPLVFKMKKDWTGDGRNVTSVTRGHFLVIAPRTWERTGHVSVKPEPCSDSDCLAHFFFAGDSEFAPERGGFEGHPIARRGSGFQVA